MKVAYVSLTGNIVRFVNKLKDKLPNCEFERVVRQGKIDEPFILITYSINFGMTPVHVKELLESSGDNLLAVIGSGNRNWGKHFCRGAINVSEQYQVPLLHTFELSGANEDVEIVANKIKDMTERMG